MRHKLLRLSIFVLIISLFSMNVLVVNAEELPSYYNLADNYNIKVENQGSEGNCWAFASLETIETYLQVHGYGTFDFSENHLNYIESNLFPETNESRDINTSGSFNEFKEYVGNKFGPVNEEDFPYGKSYTKEELPSLLEVTPVAYVDEYESFTKDDNYTEDELIEFRNNVKKHIMENGALTTSIISPSYYDYEYYNPNTYSAYFNEKKYEFTNHSHLVAIIGWDDNYSKDNFLEDNKPLNDGAYIVLNSWGLDFGDEGLYYISYEDAYVEQYLNGIKSASLDTSNFTNVDTIKFNDDNLYNALKEVIGRKAINYNDETNEITISKSDIEAIVELDLSDKNISDLTGLDSFYNIKYLYLNNNKLTSLNGVPNSVISFFIENNLFEEIPSQLYGKTIDRLFIGSNPINDFSNLKNINNITYLDIKNTLFSTSDLSFIKDMDIKFLDVSNTKVTDFTSINDKELYSLVINGVKDIKYETIPTLEANLGLSNTDIDEDKIKLFDASKVKSLDISYTNFKDLSKLPNSLETLNISGNKDVINLDSISNIKNITYRDADITDITPFINFNTYQLDLSNNKINTYYDLLSNTSLSFLILSNNEIDYFFDSDSIVLSLDNNKFRPTFNYNGNIDTLFNQYYEETVDVDSTRNNNIIPISNYLDDLNYNHVNYSLENATYENQYLKILDYDKDIVINFINGKYDKSKVIYHLNKINESSLTEIYVKTYQDKQIYQVGENFDSKGLVVVGIYDNNSTTILNNYEIIDGDNLQYGTTEVTIKKNEFTTTTSVTVVGLDDVLNLSFDNKVIYDSLVSMLEKIEKIRKENYSSNSVIIISKDDNNQKLCVLKNEFENIGSLYITSDEITSLNGIEDLVNMDTLSLNGKNLSDISAINRLINNQINKNTYLLSTLYIIDNQKIKKLDIKNITNLEIKNSIVNDINDMSNLYILKYEGNEILNFDKIVNTLKNIEVKSVIDISSLKIDKDNNIILPDIIKTLYDNGITINAYLNDRTRSEEYIRSLTRKDLQIDEVNGKLVINADSIKNYIDKGLYQYITISAIDNIDKYNNFKYNMDIYYNKNSILDHLEIDNYSPINVYEGEVADLSNLNIYKVYMDNSKEKITNYTYDKLPLSISDKEIIITYKENNVVKKLSVSVNVLKKENEIDNTEAISNIGNKVVSNNTNNIIVTNTEDNDIKEEKKETKIEEKKKDDNEKEDKKIDNKVNKETEKIKNESSNCLFICIGLVVLIIIIVFIVYKKKRDKK